MVQDKLEKFSLMKDFGQQKQYGGKRLYHYNEDDFFIQILILNRLFSNVIKEKLFKLINSLDLYIFV